jgi:hypothetical protein
MMFLPESDKKISNTFNTSNPSNRPIKSPIENPIMFWSIMYGKYIILILFSIYFHQYVTLTNYRPRSFLFTTIIPLIIIGFRDRLNLKMYNTVKTEDELTKLLHDEMKKEEMLMTLIPAITFGISLMLSGKNTIRILEHVMPYLASTLMLGTIIPLVILLFSTHRSTDALLEIESVIMAFEFSAMGYISCAIILVFLHYTRKRGLK